MDLSDHREGRICRLSAMKAADKVTQTPAVIEDTASQWCTVATRTTTGVQDLKAAISAVDDATLCDIANTAFLKLALKHGIDTNPADFVSLSITAMKQLQEKRKNNLLYKFAFCIANNRPGSDVPLFPLDRMPFGLVEYQIEFFAATNIAQVGHLAFYLFSIARKSFHNNVAPFL